MSVGVMETQREKEARHEHIETTEKHVYDLDEDMIHHVDNKERRDVRDGRRADSEMMGYEQRAARHEEREKLGSLAQTYNTMFREGSTF